MNTNVREDILVMDIETIPDIDTPKIVLSMHEAKWDKKKTKLDAVEKQKEASLSPYLGKVVCIGMLSGQIKENDHILILYGENEKLLLGEFFKFFGSLTGPMTLVTFNGRSFDMRFLMVRSALHGYPAGLFMSLMMNRYKIDDHFDVREILSNFNRYEIGSLSMMAALFGSPIVPDEDASIFDYYMGGESELIKEKCRGDIIATHHIYQRLTDTSNI